MTCHELKRLKRIGLGALHTGSGPCVQAPDPVGHVIDVLAQRNS